MSDIIREIGHNIRVYRKKAGLTLDALSLVVHKGKSTLSKYETGEIAVDIETLYLIASALHVHVEQLLCRERELPVESQSTAPTFFDGVRQFYSYVYDGRNGSVLPSVLDVLGTDGSRSRIRMYMNYREMEAYQQCETTYAGHMEHYDAVTNIILTNQDSPMERAGARILASYLDSDTKWGLWTGLSSRPLMPIAAKMLFTKKPLKEHDPLLQALRITREDIRLLRLYNMFPVI